MKQEILKRVAHYALGDDESALRNNEIRAKSPVLFVVLGKKVKESIRKIKAEVSQTIMNAEGIAYLYIDIEEGMEEEQVTSLVLPIKVKNEKYARGLLEKQLFKEEEVLKTLNGQITKVRESILAKGKMFRYWEQIQVSVITEASEIINRLLPHIVVLLKKKLEQDFKQVAVDLFTILEETTYTPLEQAISISFLREIQAYQEKDYYYENPLELLEDGLTLNTVYNQPLFNLTFILSDKKENGQKIEEVKGKHYETIAAFNLLKNREQKEIELAEAREQYNNSLFMTNISCNGEHRFASASLAKVKKPREGIYLATAYHLFNGYKEEISYQGIKESKALLAAMGLDEVGLSQLVRSSMSPKESLSEIYSVISESIGFKDLKNLSFAEAQNKLYRKSLEDFFHANFVKASERRLEEKMNKEKIKQLLYENVINHPDYGPYALEELFKIEQTKRLEELRDQYEYEIKQIERSLEEKESKLVGEVIGSKLSLLDKKYLRDLKGYLVNQVYDLKYDKLEKKLKLKAMASIRDIAEELYQEIKVELKKLEEVGSLLKDLMEETDKFKEAYLVQNVNEYYERLVHYKLAEVRKARGEHFLLEEKGIGNIASVLGQSREQFLERLFTVQEKYILADEKLFGLSFEEELLARANMLIDYEDKAVAAKSELYHMLYLSLEENSNPCVYLDAINTNHRYEEKYFMGDRKSEFMVYAYEKDKTSRNYKLAYMNDQRKSGLEKLQLMGGFTVNELIFTRTAERYYEAYLKEGYIF